MGGGGSISVLSCPLPVLEKIAQHLTRLLSADSSIIRFATRLLNFLNKLLFIPIVIHSIQLHSLFKSSFLLMNSRYPQKGHYEVCSSGLALTILENAFWARKCSSKPYFSGKNEANLSVYSKLR